MNGPMYHTLTRCDAVLPPFRHHLHRRLHELLVFLEAWLSRGVEVDNHHKPDENSCTSLIVTP